MQTVTIEETVRSTNGSDSRRIRITVSADSIIVVLDNPMAPLISNRAEFFWEELADVEHLAEAFDTETVRVFKVLVGMLAKVYAAKDFYKALT